MSIQGGNKQKATQSEPNSYTYNLKTFIEMLNTQKYTHDRL